MLHTRRPLFLLLAALIGSLFGAMAPACSEDGIIPPELTRAEAMMDLHPDSALTILERMDTTDFPSPRAGALYALLLAQAHDKCYLPIGGDSLISEAAAYFRRVGDKAAQTRACYYLGRALYDSGEERKALYAYFKSADLAAERGDAFWEGMASRGAADIFNRNLSAHDDSVYSRRELEAFRRCGRQPYLDYAILDYAYALYGTEHYEKVATLCAQLLDSASVHRDAQLRYLSLSLLASSLWCMDRFDDMLRVSQQTMSCPEREADDSLYLAVALAHTGHPARAARMLDSIAPQRTSTYHHAAYQINRLAGRPAMAARSMESVDSILTLRMSDFMSHGYASAVTDFYATQELQAAERLRSSRRNTLLAVLGGVIAMAIGAVIAAMKIRAKQRSIDDKVQYAQQLQLMLQAAKVENEGALTVIDGLMSTKTGLLDELCEIVFKSSFSRAAKRQIADMVTALIDSLSIDGTRLAELEETANIAHQGLMRDFRRDFPALKDADYYIFLLSSLNVSAVTICLLIKEEKLAAVYNRKRRLKNKILASGVPLASKYLLFLQ